MIATKKTVPIIQYPQLDELYQDMLDCQELTLTSGESHCMALEGGPGAGKSTLVRAFVEKSLISRTYDGYQPRALYVMTPSSQSIGAIATAILKQLGDPYPSKGRVWEQKHRIIELINDLDVDTICLDDFHYLWAGRSVKTTNELVNYITVLIKSTGKTFIVVGTPGELSRILDTSLQLSRHFAFRESLAPFPFKEDEEKNEFNRFITLAEQTIGYSLDPDEARQKLVGKIHKATKGVVGNIMNLMRGSALYARHDDSPVILRHHLRKAYRKRLSGQVNLKGNPNPF